MQAQRIGFIGAGNMAQNLIAGLMVADYPAENIFVSDKHPEKVRALVDCYKIQGCENNLEIIKSVDAVVLAVKPQVLPQLMAELAECLNTHDALIISIAAAVSLSNLQAGLNQNTRIIRAMPNVAARVQNAATALFAGANATDADRDLAERVMRAVGTVVWVEKENLLDVVTAIAGSGPAYFFWMMAELQRLGESHGLSRESAALLVKQTALGSAHMAIQTEQPLEVLKRAVMSPGGMTEAAFDIIDNTDTAENIEKAVSAALARAAELRE